MRASTNSLTIFGRGWSIVYELNISPQRKAYLKSLKKNRIIVRTAQIVLPILFFGLWELAARRGWIDPFIMSSPCRIIGTFKNLYISGDLFRHLGVSCLETVIGFTLGTLTGALIATALWWSPTLSKILDPYLVVLNSLPKTALGPIFIVWIGAGPASIIAMTLAISLIVTILEVHNGFVATDRGKILLMRSFGASKAQILFKLVIPANITTLVNALKVNVGLSWVGVIMGEFLVSKEGLGYLIVYGSQVFKMDLVMATVILLIIAAAVMYQCVLLLERALKKHLGVNV